MSTQLRPARAADGGEQPSSALQTRTAKIVQLVAALPALPADDGSRYSIRRLTASWLLESLTAAAEHGTLRTDNTLPPTVVSHHRDLDAYLTWCERDRIDPLAARSSDLGLFRVWRELHGPRGRVAKPATVARALASVSSWYRYLQANSDTVTTNPAAATRRPKVPRASTTVGLTPHEIDALIAAADAAAAARRARWQERPTDALHARYLAALRDRALLRLLADLGLRINEALARDINDLAANGAHRTLRFIAKGNQERERPLTPDVITALEEYLTARAEAAGIPRSQLHGPLLATGEASRLAEPNVFTALRRLARTAGIASADRLSPHSLRHAFATQTLNAGAALRDVQDAMGHADPGTTRRYDRDKNNLDRDPAYLIGALRAQRQAGRR